ncbi:UDP-glucose 4-epimerase family protein [Hydrogenophaga sp. BPS33]|uniref:UDP-glucose 4-epimerase family protein n=1 Tax=Hydrogenophaga sp. BPS33 TaxID=2651974 RepID=UPI0013201D62|nr:SDR family oxidoreductase [Hydrogenophaga sp. BPS33]QHE83752.1 SDR family oxidoreductase [Hydrogenophaga sp. BPS33]
MTLLVTGANGFVGKALCREAMARDMLVRAAQRDPVSVQDDVDTVSVGAIHAQTPWAEALRDVRTVLHTAARVHVMHDPASDPLSAFRETNTNGTLHLARQAAQAGVRRFVFVSSIKVNGEHTTPGRRFSAHDSPAPQDPYGISKHEAEEGLRQIARETGLEVVIVRPPLVYGPGVKANFASLLRAVRRGLPLPLGAATDNQRSLVALDNLVDLLITCIDHAAAANQTFLVSDGEDLSTADLVRRMGKALGTPARLLPVPTSLLKLGATALGKGDVAQRLLGNLQVDIAHTRDTLGWAPPIGVDEGLRRAAAPQVSR